MNKFFQSRGGTLGVVLLILLVLTGVLGPFLVDASQAESHWRDISYWQDSPGAAPPSWAVNPFGSPPPRRSLKMTGEDPKIEFLEGGGRRHTWKFTFPQDFFGSAAIFIPGESSNFVLISTQDSLGAQKELDRRLVEATPGQPGRIVLNLPASQILLVSQIQVLGAPDPEAPTILLTGEVSGLLGTDGSKRDVFTGIILGLKWALILGVAVSILTVLMGLGLGILAACSGGWIDALLNRVYEFFSLLPLLPLLIILSTIYKPSLWSFLVLGLLFFWTKAFKPVYAMALQIRNEVYVEAGRSLGAGRWHLATRYVLPALLPYGFSIMALSIPGIIFYESSISLLGLGDSSAVTWGQMLHDAFVQGAVINRLWWWVLPPGLMIGLTGLTFALLGRGFDRVWNNRR